MRDTSSFLTDLTTYAAVVVGPQPKASPIRGLQVVRMSTDQAMIVVVHANAAIERILVPIDETIGDDQLHDAAEALAAAWTNHAMGTERAPAPTNDPVIDAVAAMLNESLSEATPEHAVADLYVDGTSSVAGLFDAVEQVKEVLSVLEKQYTVVTLVKDVLDRGAQRRHWLRDRRGTAVRMFVGAGTGRDRRRTCR